MTSPMASSSAGGADEQVVRRERPVERLAHEATSRRGRAAAGVGRVAVGRRIGLSVAARRSAVAPSRCTASANASPRAP